MKQIFDWLREQIKEESANGFGTNGAFFSYLPTVRAEKVINEAEAKWESEVCEWKPVGYRKEYVEAHEFWLDKMQAECFKLCPYCGKPIKISEVE